jgi:demethylmenaquinone methyltransferase / 2-methoxy-6-polyprenyl-1,4-benzoquinol methylase
MTYNKQDPETIQTLFGSIAEQYDRTNNVLSFQLHKRWNAELIKAIAEKSPRTLLDLCCGTGEIALNYLKQMPVRCQAYLLDFCEEMLQCAKAKAEDQLLNHHTLTYLQADAQEIPLAKESVKACTIAYGIRNIKDPKRCIEEVYRVLEPGGCLAILELTQPQNKLIRLGHSCYLRFLLPRIGRLLTKNREAYQYLCESIQGFVDPQVIENQMKEAKFVDTYRKPLNGGIATLIFGQKPL